MWKALIIYTKLIGAQIRSQMQYRISFLMEAIGTILITVLEYASLALVFYRFQDLKGWNLGEIAFLYGLAEISFGVMDLLFGGFDPGDFGLRVRRGSFDQLLLRPVSITLQVLGSRFLLRRIGKVAVGIIIFNFAVAQTDINWTTGKLLYLPVIILGQVSFFGGLFMIGSTITFWTVESIEIINIFTYGGSFMISYPMHIYQDWLRRFFTYLIPAAFLNYYPALYYLDKPDPFQLPAFTPFLAPMAGFGVFLMALAFWHFGVRHYKSTGT